VSVVYVDALAQLYCGSMLAIDFSGTDGIDVRGVIVTTCGTDDETRQYDFVSRYFSPWNGIKEDPVTGSAHTVLAKYWSDHLHKSSFFCSQLSARGGELAVQIQGDDRVHLQGYATTVLKGHICCS